MQVGIEKCMFRKYVFVNKQIIIKHLSSPKKRRRYEIQLQTFGNGAGEVRGYLSRASTRRNEEDILESEDKMSVGSEAVLSGKYGTVFCGDRTEKNDI